MKQTFNIDIDVNINDDGPMTSTPMLTLTWMSTSVSKSCYMNLFSFWGFCFCLLLVSKAITSYGMDMDIVVYIHVAVRIADVRDIGISVYCIACGQHAVDQVRGLGKPCSKDPNARGRPWLNKMARGIWLSDRNGEFVVVSDVPA